MTKLWNIFTELLWDNLTLSKNFNEIIFFHLYYEYFTQNESRMPEFFFFFLMISFFTLKFFRNFLMNLFIFLIYLC